MWEHSNDEEEEDWEGRYVSSNGPSLESWFDRALTLESMKEGGLPWVCGGLTEEEVEELVFLTDLLMS